MKKEQFFSLIGELDDRFLERYRQMDMRLSYKAMRKKRTLRVLAVAACLCLLIGACVPVGIWLVKQSGNDPSNSPPTICLQGLAELETMREMIACKDEQVLNEYLHNIAGGGAHSRQDLIDFVNLVESTPYVQVIDGEITDLTYYGTDERFSVSAQAENGDSLMVSYELGMSDVEKNMEKVARKLGKKNLLSAPLSTQDGRLTLYTETREPSSNGEVIRWQGVLDGVAVYIVYWVADADAIDTAALLDRLKIADSIVPQFPGYAWANTKFGPFVQEPQLKNYGVLQENGVYGSMGWGQAQDYQDPDAPVTYIAPYPIANEVAALEYVTSMSQSLDRQAIHVYMARTDTAEYSVYVDAQTRECIGWQVEGEAFGVPYATEQEKLAATYQYLQEHVRDPEAYTPSVTEQDGYIYCRYSRYVGSFDSCDEVTALFDGQGYMVAVIGDYLGALRDMQEVPEALLNAVQVQLEEIRDTYADAVMKEITVKNLHIFSTGQILLDCSLTVRNQQSDESTEYKYYAYLTEYVQ